MLVVDTDFAVFNPSEHLWGIIWFSDFYKEPGLVYRLFDSLAQRVRRGDDVLGYIGTPENKRLLDKLQSHVEIKPGIFGVSVDVKEILKNITGAA